MMFIEGKSKIRLIIVRIRVMVHAHDFPLSKPHAIKKDIAPSAIMMVLTMLIIAVPPKFIMSIPNEPHKTLKDMPNAIAIAPEIISSIARIVTPVGLIWVDMKISTRSDVISYSYLINQNSDYQTRMTIFKKCHIECTG